MNENGQLLDLVAFAENRRRFPPERLLAYSGRYIAWSGDGLGVVASADDREGLYVQLRKAGIPVSQVVFDYVDPPDVSVLG